jgi:hypothetical protein
MPIFCLTPLTRSGGERRVLISGFDVRWRTFVIAAFAAFPALIATMIVWIFAGQLALVMIPIVEGGAFWLVESRQRNGLHLRQYQAMADRRKATTGRFYCCGVQIDPSRSEFGMIMANTVPVPGRGSGPRNTPEPQTRQELLDTTFGSPTGPRRKSNTAPSNTAPSNALPSNAAPAGARR